MDTKCDLCPLRRLKLTRTFSPAELAAVKRMKLGERRASPREEVVSIGETSPHVYTLLSGLAFRHHTLPDGRRQILNFLFPTDLIGLQAGLFKESPHAITMLTDGVLCAFDRNLLTGLFRETPELAYDVIWMAAEQQMFVDLNLVAIGKFRSEQRLAYLLLSFHTRMGEVGLAEGWSCPLPITQTHMAEALGLSQPYANAALGKLRSDGLLRVSGGRLDILDMARLRELAVVAPEPRQRAPFL